MSDPRRWMLYVPEIEPESFFFFYFEGETGRSYSVRTYTHPDRAPVLRRQTDFPYRADEILQRAVHAVTASPHRVDDTRHWWSLTNELNRAHLGREHGGAVVPSVPSVAPVPAKPSGAPPDPSREDLFFSAGGTPLRSLDDWRAQHPELHWRAGYSAMELARTWSTAHGLPASFRSALSEGALRGLTVERGVVEHKTSVPGKGGNSCTDLMVFARTASGSPVVVGVEGKVDESFGPFVGDWLRKAESEAHPRNREERLAALCGALGLQPGQLGAVRYQLLHRAYAALETARSTGASEAVVAVHSLQGRGPRGANWEDFRAFARMLGCATLLAGTPAHVGTRHGVSLWLLWVTEGSG